MPGGVVPALELNDGTILGEESNDILRFLARTHGYHPTDPMKAFYADALADDYKDLL